MQRQSRTESECLIIGGGPAGLTAAVYLGRFRRDVIVIDEGHSRAGYIKHSYNYPGSPHGISGKDLLKNLREQAEKYGVTFVTGKVTELGRDENGEFSATAEGCEYKARKVLLATGSVDEKPDLPHIGEFIYEGAVRFCPICDGYEALDKKIGILGPLDHIIPKSLFLSTYSRDLVLLPTDHLEIDDADRDKLSALGIRIPSEKAVGLSPKDDKVEILLTNGERIEFDIVYPAMGTNPRSGLAIRLGASHNEFECLIADAHQRTSVPGLYVAGDLTTDLSQISVATGQAAIAATDMHNSLPRNPR